MPFLRCPVCEKPIDPDGSPCLPFCGRRCRRIDLERWLSEGYGMPYEPEEGAGGEVQGPDSDGHG